MTAVKICGLKDPEHLRLAARLGARYAGLVFYPPSPRAVSVPAAASLVAAGGGIGLVGLFVDPDDALLDAAIQAVPLAMIQLHGDESPKRVQDIRQRWKIPVMKALKVAAPEDLAGLSSYENICDWILFDAKSSGPLPGGNGAVFDWTILKNIRPRKPWMLSGGLTPENVKLALSVLSPDAMDVSSGVEDAPGMKSPAKIQAFIDSVMFARIA
jgi:phosphoribosylanthranilate isomerase